MQVAVRWQCGGNVKVKLATHTTGSAQAPTCAVSVWNWTPFGAVYPSGM